MEIISVISTKGGVGKATVAANIGQWCERSLQVTGKITERFAHAERP